MQTGVNWNGYSDSHLCLCERSLTFVHSRLSVYVCLYTDHSIAGFHRRGQTLSLLLHCVYLQTVHVSMLQLGWQSIPLVYKIKPNIHSNTGPSAMPQMSPTSAGRRTVTAGIAMSTIPPFTWLHRHNQAITIKTGFSLYCIYSIDSLVSCDKISCC